MATLNAVLDRLERARSLDRAAGPVAGAVHRAVPSGALADALHGVWLGHPAHPAVVQLPLGAWLSAAVLDLTGGGRTAARRLVGLGVLATPAAAAAGLADWAELEPEQRRVGLVHAATNALATACFAASYLARRRGQHARGVLTGLLGLAAGGIGGILGGHLAYTQAAGANHAEGGARVAGTGWHDLGPVEDFPDGTPVGRSAGPAPVAVCRDGERLAVLFGMCSHLGGPLHRGRIVPARDGTCLECPWHGSRFALADGAVAAGPATAAQPVFETRVVDGRLQARAHPAGDHWA